jgi:hypothetical protein
MEVKYGLRTVSTASMIDTVGVGMKEIDCSWEETEFHRKDLKSGSVDGPVQPTHFKPSVFLPGQQRQGRCN